MKLSPRDWQANDGPGRSEVAAARERVRVVCETISADAEADASTLDGRPVARMGEDLGRLYAAVQTLANICHELIDWIQDVEDTAVRADQ